MQRRDFGKVVGGIALGAAGLNTLTQDAQAVSVAMEGLDVPDESVATSTPVVGARIRVLTNFSWRTSTTPTRAVLRLRATYAGETQQLGAMAVPGALKPEQSGEHTFTQNLLDHPEITAPALTPDSVGETATLTFGLSVSMTVYGDSGRLGEQTIQDTATIEVRRKQATIETTLSGSGSVDVLTKTPT